MADLILHHYDTSPFSEKIRLILGHKGLPWQSVQIPRIAPKPELTALTGGYRKTPVLQIGADLYCDTALICDVLEHLAPLPSIYPEPSKGLARTLAQWGDTTLFWTAMSHNLSPAGAADLFGTAPPEVAKAFSEDRRAMGSPQFHSRPGDATAAYKSYLRRLSDMLDSGPFLLGELPTVADFACYHPLWFTRVRTPSMADVLELTPAVLDWMDRVAAIGHGTATPLEAKDAITIANEATPASLLRDSAFQNDHGIPLGSRVSVAAERFGTETSEGLLVAASRTHYSIERNADPLVGRVQVHFPRIGFALRRVEG